MRGYPQPQGREPGSEQDNRWPPVTETSVETDAMLSGSPHARVRQENRRAWDVSPRAVDNAIHFLQSARLL